MTRQLRRKKDLVTVVAMIWLVVVSLPVFFYLFFSSHELEVVDLFQLGDDELAPHVRDFHLQLMDLHITQLDTVLNVVEGGFAGYKSESKHRHDQLRRQ